MSINYSVQYIASHAKKKFEPLYCTRCAMHHTEKQNKTDTFGMLTFCIAVLHVFKCWIMFFESDSGDSKICICFLYGKFSFIISPACMDGAFSQYTCSHVENIFCWIQDARRSQELSWLSALYQPTFRLHPHVCAYTLICLL